MTFELIDVRNQYTIHLKKILIDHIWDGINSLYLKSRELKGPWMVTFQTFLKDIKNWNTEQIKKAASDVETNVNHKSPNFLKELLTTIIVLNVKVLSSACSTNKELLSEHIEINIPTTSEFIYDLYIGVAKKVYNNPSLFDHNVNIKTLTINIDFVYKIIADTVEEVLSSFLPYESLITQYLQYMNDEGPATNPMAPPEPDLEEETTVKEEAEEVKEESIKDDSSVKSESDTDSNKSKKIVIKHREPQQKTKTSFFSDADSDSD
jgi:hypothetical protein